MEMVIFFVLAAVGVMAAIGVIAAGKPVRSALFLLVNFCSLAGLYILLNAQFVALVQVIVYAGAVVVLFLFVVMLLGVEQAASPRPASGPDRRLRWGQGTAGGLLGALLLAGIVWALVQSPGPQDMAAQALMRTDNVRQVGTALLTDFAVPFELAAVVLLVAVIGAVVLAKRKLEG